jgi:hypothetical protein
MMAVERKFWNNKYEQGGISGRGSIGLYRNWKWNQIQFAIGTDIHSLIDVGCGDMSFWNHPIAKKMMKDLKYTGIDISDNIIKRNRKALPDLDFIIAPAHVEQPGLRAQAVFALDLLFHIMDDGEYEMLIETLCQYASQYLVIYTWMKNPFTVLNRDGDGVSQKYRPLGNVKHIFSKNNMQLVVSKNVPYDEFGRLYVFERLIY